MSTSTTAKDTLIVVVIDQSSSMANKRDEVITGFNAFVDQQKSLPGKAALSIVMFNTVYITPVVNIPIERINVLDRTNYVPSGMTALLDAIGRAITDTANVLAGRQAIICIITDGEENSSKEFTKEQIKTMIEAREAEGWDFIYLGANQDAFSNAAAMGIALRNVANYDDKILGQTQASYTAASQAVSSKRMTGTVNMDWKVGSGLIDDTANSATAGAKVKRPAKPGPTPLAK